MIFTRRRNNNMSHDINPENITLEQVRESIELAWSDAVNLPQQILYNELCDSLANAASCIDTMIDIRKKQKKNNICDKCNK